MRILISIFLISFIFCETRDVVYLKNGSIIKGVVIEQVINDYIKIESGDNLFVYKFDEVLRIEKEVIPQDINTDYNIVQNKLNTSLYIWTSLYAITIGTFAIIDGGIESEILIPGIGPLLVLDYADDDYHSVLIASSALQLGYMIDYFIGLNKMKEYKENKYSFNIIPYPENPTLNLSFKF